MATKRRQQFDSSEGLFLAIIISILQQLDGKALPYIFFIETRTLDGEARSYIKVQYYFISVQQNMHEPVSHRLYVVSWEPHVLLRLSAPAKVLRPLTECCQIAVNAL